MVPYGTTTVAVTQRRIAGLSVRADFESLHMPDKSTAGNGSNRSGMMLVDGSPCRPDD